MIDRDELFASDIHDRIRALLVDGGYDDAVISLDETAAADGGPLVALALLYAKDYGIPLWPELPDELDALADMGDVDADLADWVRRSCVIPSAA